MDVVMVGSGGCMRELAWQMLACGPGQGIWDIKGYVDIDKPLNGRGIHVGGKDILYLGDDTYLEGIREPMDVVVSIGNPKTRKGIVERLKENPVLRFPNIILSNAYVCADSNIKDGAGSEGCIISMDCRVSTNVVVGDFLFMNTGSMICHDGRIGEFVTLGPDVKLAGAVEIGKNTDIGMGAKVIQGLSIGSDVIVGAGSVVIRDVANNSKVVGIPAR